MTEGGVEGPGTTSPLQPSRSEYCYAVNDSRRARAVKHGRYAWTSYAEMYFRFLSYGRQLFPFLFFP